MRASINNSHRPLAEARRQIARLTEPEPNLNLIYMKCIECREAVADCMGGADRQIESFRSELGQILKVLPLLRRMQREGTNEVVECPIDGAKLRVPAGRGRLLVTCPSCKYVFIVSTASEAESPRKGRGRGRLAGFLKLFAPGKPR